MLHTLEHVPNEILLEILSFLDVENLMTVKRVSKLWNHLLDKSFESCFIYKNLAKSMSSDNLMIQKDIESILTFSDWKQLTRSLFELEYDTNENSFDFFQNSIICRGMKASSVDDDSQEVGMTRSPSKHRFWSSKGSKKNNTDEWCLYQCQKPRKGGKYSLMYVSEVCVRFFKAAWQDNHVYTSRKMSLTFHIGEDAKPSYTTQMFPIQHSDDVQSFPLELYFLYAETVNMTEIPQPDVMSQANLMDIFRSVVRSFEEEQVDPSRDQLHDSVFRIVKEQQEEQETVRTTQGSLYCTVNYFGKVEQQPMDQLYFTCVEKFDLKGLVVPFL